MLLLVAIKVLYIILHFYNKERRLINLCWKKDALQEAFANNLPYNYI